MFDWNAFICFQNLKSHMRLCMYPCGSTTEMLRSGTSLGIGRLRSSNMRMTPVFHRITNERSGRVRWRRSGKYPSSRSTFSVAPLYTSSFRTRSVTPGKGCKSEGSIIVFKIVILVSGQDDRRTSEGRSAVTTISVSMERRHGSVRESRSMGIASLSWCKRNVCSVRWIIGGIVKPEATWRQKMSQQIICDACWKSRAMSSKSQQMTFAEVRWFHEIGRDLKVKPSISIVSGLIIGCASWSTSPRLRVHRIRSLLTVGRWDLKLSPL